MKVRCLALPVFSALMDCLSCAWLHRKNFLSLQKMQGSEYFCNQLYRACITYIATTCHIKSSRMKKYCLGNKRSLGGYLCGSEKKQIDWVPYRVKVVT